ncbi:hypothetical protein THTE_0404 [Thermogutta terrifontis]|uniref:Uncharacterized protein n=1 Tax=Thermogutta terrifontis TaxID=1331910 RepID=A0A286RAL6_9BACT|nr:hypothetical protein THTE_0404 [Thermogutta terrifontis]
MGNQSVFIGPDKRVPPEKTDVTSTSLQNNGPDERVPPEKTDVTRTSLQRRTWQAGPSKRLRRRVSSG